MTPRLRSGLPVLLALVLAACAGARGDVAASQGPTFIVVRHAEKLAQPPDDPGLDARGQARAEALAALLADTPLTAVYTTDFRRTRATVASVAARQGLTPRTYDARLPASAFAAQLRAAHPAGTILVAGHSNTVPDIVAALCECEAGPMPDTEYDRVSVVRIGPEGAVLEVSRYRATASAP
ncbi:phosphoglycerate mutase family protein [Luteimonas kalidii]|uniref:Phosphoglycerate mutase family protein n=1 Tax=Luteimonas kalidii TaxID=3042025 RepID=A0ABT6JQS5_9GAMM|nr:phosphoglycerate mutase family protein [Luteimonas kalidii]MDH5832964.1 phosphoglycerate mutase family protein [Luteimonas kalidii]